jgi:hypothetical protein
MEAERAWFLSAGEGSEAGIGADVLAGDSRVVAGYGLDPLPCGNGSYKMTLSFSQASQLEILCFAQDDSGRIEIFAFFPSFS